MTMRVYTCGSSMGISGASHVTSSSGLTSPSYTKLTHALEEYRAAVQRGTLRPCQPRTVANIGRTYSQLAILASIRRWSLHYDTWGTRRSYQQGHLLCVRR